MSTHLPFPSHLRPRFAHMTADDVPHVMAIEPLSFPTPWSAGTYLNEIRNRNGSYWVVRPGMAGPGVPYIFGYGGMWILGEEAHITTIAIHPDWRRRYLGEWLLIHLVGAARAAVATAVTLEVRVSNHNAQALYRKLGFETVGLRRGYYQDTKEDAQLLSLFDVDQERVWQPLLARLQVIEGG